jgi:hypothetical protein
MKTGRDHLIWGTFIILPILGALALSIIGAIRHALQ